MGGVERRLGSSTFLSGDGLSSVSRGDSPGVWKGSIVDKEALEGKVILVTGAARSLGASMAAYFESVGGTAIRTDINPAQGVVELDVTKIGQWESVVADVIREHGHLDGLVNNAAAFFGARPFWAETDAEFARLLDVNVMGTWLGIKVAARAMAPKWRGSIVNFSSTSGMMGSDMGFAGYGTTRWAVRGLTKHSAADLAAQGVRVNSIHPHGIVGTGMMPVPRNRDDEAARDAANPMGRTGMTDDVSSMVTFLLSDRSTWITGREFVIDGGATLTCAL